MVINKLKFKNIFFSQNEKGQVTIFVIIAILLIAIVALLLTLSPVFRNVNQAGEENPKNFIQTCLEDSIKDSVEIISTQGGSIEPENYFLYNDDKLQYLCYTNEYYQLCTMQIPFLREHIQDEITENIKSDVDSCFNSLKENYKDSQLTEGDIKVELLPNKIVTTISSSFTFTKKEKTERVEMFSVVINNNLYELSSIAQSILDWETTLGEADTLNYMDIYHELKVEKKPQTDETKIYIITDKNTKQKFQFASRSLAFPPGF